MWREVSCVVFSLLEARKPAGATAQQVKKPPPHPHTRPQKVAHSGKRELIPESPQSPYVCTMTHMY